MDQLDFTFFDGGSKGNGKTRADQIFERFVEFHRNNPQVWQLFHRFANVMRKRREKWGAKGIYERIRWEIATSSQYEGVKLNNDFTAYYARMYMAVHPDAQGFFELRRRKSDEKSAYEEDLAVIRDNPASGEERLYAELLTLAEEVDNASL